MLTLLGRVARHCHRVVTRAVEAPLRQLPMLARLLNSPRSRAPPSFYIGSHAAFSPSQLANHLLIQTSKEELRFRF